MSRLFWLSLLLGYVAGIAIALVFLPDPVVEPFYGALALGSVAVVGGLTTLVALAASRGRARPGGQTHASVAAKGEDRRQLAARSAGAPATSQTTREQAAGSATPAAEAAPVSEDTLVQILTDGRVDMLALPVAALSDDEADYIEAVPRLRTAHGRHLEPAEYRALAARWGLTAEVDRLLLLRCMAVVGDAMAKGEEVRVLCSIAATSLDDPDLVTTLRRLVDDGELSKRLLVTLDRMRLHRPARAELARLIEDGLNVCLRRLSIETIDLPGLAEAGCSFVKLDAPRHALRPGEDELPPPLKKLRQRFARSAITVLVDLEAEPALIGSTGEGVPASPRVGPKEAASRPA